MHLLESRDSDCLPRIDFSHASCMLVVFCKPTLAILLQRNINVSRMLVVLCKPILAILAQRKRPISRMHHTCWLYFVNHPYWYKETSDDHQCISHVGCVL